MSVRKVREHKSSFVAKVLPVLMHEKSWVIGVKAFLTLTINNCRAHTEIFVKFSPFHSFFNYKYEHY